MSAQTWVDHEWLRENYQSYWRSCEENDEHPEPFGVWLRREREYYLQACGVWDIYDFRLACAAFEEHARRMRWPRMVWEASS